MKRFVRLLSLALSLCLLCPVGLLSAFAAQPETDAKAVKKLENLALAKNVTVSGGRDADAVADDSLATYWDSTPTGASGPATVTLDLGYAFEVENVTVVTYYDTTRYYHFDVAVSVDGENYTTIGSKTDNTPATPEGTTFEVGAERVRYVKVTMKKNSANPEYHICELKVMGYMDPNYVEPTITEDPNDPDNIAIGKPTRANYNDLLSKRVTDGNVENSWNGNMYPQYVDVDLMDNYDISEIIVYMPVKNVYTFTVYGSLDGISFDRLADSNEKKKGVAEGEKFVFETPVNYRVIRVNVTSSSMGGAASVCEIKVHGKKNNTPVIPTRTELSFTSYDEWLLKNHGVDTSKLKDEKGNYRIEDTYTKEDTVEALQGLVTRILGGQYVDWFVFEVAESPNEYDYFEISNAGGKIKIKGNSGVAIASGLNHYLKYYCNVNVSQQTKQVNMPATAPAVEKTIYKDTICKVRYAYNYCTLSYTMQFYGFDTWQRELDYLMLQGVNVILDTTATEALWVMYLQQYGYTAQEAIDFVCGYAYKAWWLMGNLENYGGSVADQWLYDTLEMARVNQRYMSVMGAEPCLQVFAGTLPTNFAKKASGVLEEKGYPNVENYLSSTGSWTDFVRPYALNTTFPGFATMANDFYETQNHLYGQITDFYAGDFLHELMGGFQLDPSYNKAQMSRVVLDLMLEENPEGCWIMQSWWENPLPDVVAGFGEDREDHVLMLDLSAVHDPRWKNTTSFGGKEFGNTGWAYCMLDNYGGKPGMHGAFRNVLTGLLDVYKNAKHFKGIGITPEGTEENPASYDFFWELIWLTPDDLPADQNTNTFAASYVKEWTENYAKRRYGSDDPDILRAWEILSTSVYGYKTPDGASYNTIMTNNPRIFANGVSGETAYRGGYSPLYRANALEQVLELLLKHYDELKDEETYIYDLCDIMLQVVCNSTGVYLDKMAKAITKKDIEEFKGYKRKFLRCMQLANEINMYEQDMMLGNWAGKRIEDWVNDDRTGDYSDYDIDTMKHNALTLITTWSSGTQLIGYANRSYSGLISEFHYKNWETYLNETETNLRRSQWKTADTTPADYFAAAWELIVSRGEGLPTEAKDAKTPEFLALCKEVSENMLTTSEPTSGTLKVTDKSYTLQSGKLTGVRYGTLVSELKAAIKVDGSGTLTVTDAEGNVLEDGAFVAANTKVTLYDEGAFVIDELKISAVEGGPYVGFEKESITINKGESATVKVTFRGQTAEETATFTYSSADPAIATVDKDGKIVGVAAGKTTVTVTAGSYTDTLEVTVVEALPEDPSAEESADAENSLPAESDKGEGGKDDGKGGLPVGAIIAICVVAVAAIAGAIVAVVAAKKKKN